MQINLRSDRAQLRCGGPGSEPNQPHKRTVERLGTVAVHREARRAQHSIFGSRAHPSGLGRSPRQGRGDYAVVLRVGGKGGRAGVCRGSRVPPICPPAATRPLQAAESLEIRPAGSVSHIHRFGTLPGCQTRQSYPWAHVPGRKEASVHGGGPPDDVCGGFIPNGPTLETALCPPTGNAHM